MYQNIIFDLGGVVVDYAPREFLVDYFMNEKLEDQLFDITFGSEEWKPVSYTHLDVYKRHPEGFAPCARPRGPPPVLLLPVKKAGFTSMLFHFTTLNKKNQTFFQNY